MLYIWNTFRSPKVYLPPVSVSFIISVKYYSILEAKIASIFRVVECLLES